jgi:hypothetical protein
VPATQSEQAETLPALYLPRAQLAQAESPLALENVPWAQAPQSAAERIPVPLWKVPVPHWEHTLDCTPVA